jgi:hypothetical protein
MAQVLTGASQFTNRSRSYELGIGSLPQPIPKSNFLIHNSSAATMDTSKGVS